MIAFYMRTSTDKQMLDAQRVALKNWLSFRGISQDSVETYSDAGVSGRNISRKGMSALIEDIQSGRVETLITFELSRLSRNYMDFLRILDLCEKHHVTVEVPGEGVMAFESNQDKLIASIKAFLASEERQKIKIRTKAGLEAARARGVKLGRPAGTRTNKGYRKTYSEQLVQKVVQLRERGLPLREIGSLLDITPSLVQRILARSTTY